MLTLYYYISAFIIKNVLIIKDRKLLHVSHLRAPLSHPVPAHVLHRHLHTNSINTAARHDARHICKNKE